MTTRLKTFRYLLLGASLSLCLAENLHAQAQLPNSDFESWSGNNPTGWVTDNGSSFTPVTESSDVHGGAGALQASVVAIGPATIPPSAALGQSTGLHGAPYSDRPSTFSGFYKFTSQGSDVLHILLAFTKAGVAVGAAGFSTSTSVSGWTAFSVPVVYSSQNNPDTVNAAISIGFASGGNATHQGSVAIIDDLHLGNSSAVGPEPLASSFSLQQNFPNPFNPSTTITYNLEQAGFTTVNVYDLSGRQVATLVHERQEAGMHRITFDAAKLPSGIYYYRLTSGANTISRTMHLLK